MDLLMGENSTQGEKPENQVQGNNEDFNWFHGKWNCLDFPACCFCTIAPLCLELGTKAGGCGGGLDALLLSLAHDDHCGGCMGTTDRRDGAVSIVLPPF